MKNRNVLPQPHPKSRILLSAPIGLPFFAASLAFLVCAGLMNYYAERAATVRQGLTPSTTESTRLGLRFGVVQPASTEVTYDAPDGAINIQALDGNLYRVIDGRVTMPSNIAPDYLIPKQPSITLIATP